MKKGRNALTASEILNIIDKYYLNLNDIKLVACVGRNKAIEIKRAVIKMCEQENIKVPCGFIPSEKLVEYLGINISYLKKCAAIKKDTTINVMSNATLI